MSLRRGTKAWLDLYIRDLTDAGRYSFLLRFGGGLTMDGLHHLYPGMETSQAIVKLISSDGKVRAVCNVLGPEE
jgi:hypothetical protein